MIQSVKVRVSVNDTASTPAAFMRQLAMRPCRSDLRHHARPAGATGERPPACSRRDRPRKPRSRWGRSEALAPAHRNPPPCIDGCGVKSIHRFTAWRIESEMKARPWSNHLLRLRKESELVSGTLFPEANAVWICPDTDIPKRGQDLFVERRRAIKVVYPKRQMTKHWLHSFAPLRSNLNRNQILTRHESRGCD